VSKEPYGKKLKIHFMKKIDFFERLITLTFKVIKIKFRKNIPANKEWNTYLDEDGESIQYDVYAY